MGQYFKAANLDKKEYVCPFCIGQTSKLWEWAANPHGAIFTLLLRKSTDGGGGDFHGITYEEDHNAIAGRWAGDRVVLVGDYDDSQLWNALPKYRNISEPLVETWNNFIEIPDMMLEYMPCSCNEPICDISQTPQSPSPTSYASSNPHMDRSPSTVCRRAVRATCKSLLDALHRLLRFRP